MTMNPMAEDTECKQALSLQGRRLLSCFLALVLACALVPAQGLAPVAFAAEAYSPENAISNWQRYGGCEWGYTVSTDSQDSTGVYQIGSLVIRPAEGGSGQLPDETVGENLDKAPSPFPWRDPSLRSLFTSVTISPGVKAGESCKGMFANLDRVTRINLSGMDFSKTTDMSDMFRFVEYQDVDEDNHVTTVQSALEMVVFSDPADSVNTAAVTTMRNMFNGCKKLSEIRGMAFDTSNVTFMGAMFKDCASLASIDLSSFKTPKLTGMGEMFMGCASLASIDLSSLSISDVKNLASLFEGCTRLGDVRFGAFDTSKAQNMHRMFAGCETLYELDLSYSLVNKGKYFDTSSAFTMHEMFAGCIQLETLSLSGWKAEGVSDFHGMFSGCTALENLDLSGFVTSGAANMSGMFNGCNNLVNLRLDSFDTRGVGNFSNMFYGCGKLQSVFATDAFVAGSGADTTSMFEHCDALVGGYGSDYKTLQGNWQAAARIDSMATPGLLTAGDQPSFYDPVNFSDPPQAGPAIEVLPLGTEYYIGESVEPVVILRRGHCLLEQYIEYVDENGKKKDNRDTCDYEVSYRNNEGPGVGTAVITGRNQYSGSIEEEFPIVELTADDVTVAFSQPSYAFTGNAVEPKPQVSLGSKVLTEGEDYEIIGYRDNTEPGTATIILQVTTPITGTITVERTFQIARKTLAGAQVYVDYASGSYTGSPLQPGVTVLLDGNPLTPGVDYTVGYANNVNPGAATITVTGKGVYEGTVQAGFTITGPLAKAAFRLTSSAFTYDGKAKLPGVAVTLGGKTLRQGTDYVLSYQGNVNAGTAYAVVAGKGIYTGTVRVGFKINPASVTLKAIKFAPLVSKAYNKGKAISQVPTATYGTLTLKNKTDFTVSYKNNKKLGTAKVTVKGKGNYTGTKTLSFKIVRYKQTMTAKAVAKTVKFSSVKKKAASVKKPITVKKAKGKVAYSNVSTSASLKKFKVNAKNGTITVPKGTKKGTYKVKVKVEAKGTSKYAYGTKTVTVKVKVK